MLWSLAACLSVLLLLPALAFADRRAEIGKAAVFVLGPERNRDGKVGSSYGSGFLVVHDEDLFLVTAEHVARQLAPDSHAVIQGPDGNGLRIELKRLGMQAWRYHPSADLAALCLKPAEAIRSGLHGRFLPSTMIQKQESAPLRAIRLTVLGFPLALGVGGPFSPISRETKGASEFLTLKRGDNGQPATFFVAQDPSIGGFSGAPVFDTGLPYSSAEAAVTIRLRPMQIVGVVHGNAQDDTGGKLGLITPAYLVWRLLEAACGP